MTERAPLATGPAPADQRQDDKPPSDDVPDSLGEVLEQAESELGDGKVEVGQVIAAMGSASFAPVMLLPALLVLSPASGIPLLPSVCGITIALIAAQMLFGRESLWLPGWILRRKLDGPKTEKALSVIEKPARWIDKHTGRRMPWLTAAPFDKLVLVVCMLCGAIMPALELLPFTSSILGAAISVMSLGLLVRDGVLVLIGLGFVGAAASLAIGLLG
ncbi:exopolysaccharide biosynthesis protein [Frigidibacter albus]|uniref:Exopolysaccharide biosynthesis protein n=1 Tax=Frigidibacter albus TaxID=1465486 RepID=A0A6L8VK28_9RHOB|nr:exopolysaccharide biosynthesis protein [Frigidibacter albus]MZQ90715.1 exopolysaccharide biosynthesis protein [Frigidibacter albus]NBE33022.1 exopolysaccharide biosynthesis protein [Frigidibacter albus]GGH60099.1 exopolysaccharide biosynthesis protein ExoD [Frigidibacter albus]